MSQPLKLHVLYKDNLVGFINYSIKDKQFIFNYNSQWIESDDFFPISPQITNDKQEPGAIKRYLENLLPEGPGLKRFAQLIKVETSNVYALINSIGNDLSGALRIIKESQTQDTKFIKIASEELAHRIGQRKNTPIAIWGSKPRLSVAGVQDKLPVTIINGEYGFGEGQLHSTHILKFSRDLKYDLVLNEFFCMQLAKKVGLSVAETEMVHLGENVLRVKRFDRRLVNEKVVEKKHIIDGCQALDISPDDKYERFLGEEDSVKDIHGPANLENLFKLASLCSQPAATKLNILQWVLFNLFIGNSDNHYKNISFFIDKKGMRLAPYYDLVSITVYPEINHSLSFCIGDIFDPEAINKHALVLMAHELELGFPFVQRQAQQLLNKMQKALNSDLVVSEQLALKDQSFAGELKAHILRNIDRYKSILSV